MNHPDHQDNRPWGYYRILSDGPNYKVKRIVIDPGHRLSLQRHRCRSEHWYIVQGQAVVTSGEDEMCLGVGNKVDIPPGTWHRVANPCGEKLIFIEIQLGKYLSEDDIDRAHDDYGRV